MNINNVSSINNVNEYISNVNEYIVTEMFDNLCMLILTVQKKYVLRSVSFACLYSFLNFLFLTVL